MGIRFTLIKAGNMFARDSSADRGVTLQEVA